MADHRLEPLCATGGARPRSARHGAVSVAETPDLAIASVAERAGGAEALDALAQELAGAPPPEPRRVTGRPGGVQLMWTGPGQWFALAPFDTHEDMADRLAARLGGAASVTEQTDGWVCFVLEGEGATALLERLCRLDLARMQAGMADRTGIEHMNCFVICDAPGRSYRVLGARSSALSLWHALETVARGLA
ncbi:sarcosine oxidase subunit gamma [Roseibacterium sp. SDUM158017]|uniref:sarcosine oxidase subunit gamma n=1 Tax=Roseicyclus salinarum TaxID=3036773 RepID=UPI002414F6DF|nr:sarcosine oxidase subunit gamma [Roseibacterium sp. SDUM158017]MDG4647294.1 sarcosine oxidase subunit gamma [Roseibacterium sp. SDUM158017]